VSPVLSLVGDSQARESEARVLVTDNFSFNSRQDVDSRRLAGIKSPHQVIYLSSRESSDAEDQSLF
ncbi:MAG: hypothetical protein KDA38_14435, partial [Planctomycetales bacterium]|nr:hypothetical protein [Planctomycetales bacterium]